MTVPAHMQAALAIYAAQEPRRRQCEAAYVVKLREYDRTRAHAYIAKVRTKRGDAAADQLEADAKELWTNTKSPTPYTNG